MTYHDEDLLTVAEVSKELKCSPRFVYDELTRKNLRGSRIAGWRVQYRDLRTYIEATANVSRVRRSA